MISISPFSSSILLFGQSGGTPVDPDAQAFITAAAITDPTQQSAVNQLVVDLKTANIWTKMKAIYPFVGGSSSTHKFNLKDPRDLDAAFRLVFNGGWTHSSTGVQANGVNGYADTKLNLLLNLALGSNHYSFYSRTDLQSLVAFGSDMGNLGDYSASSFSNLRIRNNSLGVKYFSIGADNGASISGETSGLGFTIGSSTSITSRKIYANGITVATSTNLNNGTLPNNNASIGTGANNAFQRNLCAFASIGDGLTDTEASNFYTAVQSFQTTLSRNI
jgi:hypothetical protein